MTTPVAAQYIYLDTNNDGVHTWADSLNSTGGTPVDVWLDTGANPDGSPGFCGRPGFSSYEFILKTTGGNLSWGTWLPTLGTTTVFSASSASDYHTAVHGGGLTATTPLGAYKLGTLNVGVPSGCPSLEFGTTTALSARFATSFGSGCSGRRYDHTPRLGSDWAHSAVVGMTPSAPPSVTAPGIVAPQYLDPVVIDIAVAATACGTISSLSVDLSSLPPGHDAVFTPGSGNQSGTLTWQPTAADHGDFPVTFTATGRNPAASRSRTTVIHLPMTPTAVEQSEQGTPALALWQNRPNPFRPATSIHYSVPRETHVSLVVFDVSGRTVARLVDRVEPSGRHETRWTGRDDQGRAVASGVYWYRLTTELGTQTRRLVLAR
jgi:hypothetical protein